MISSRLCTIDSPSTDEGEREKLIEEVEEYIESIHWRRQYLDGYERESRQLENEIKQMQITLEEKEGKSRMVTNCFTLSSTLTEKSILHSLAP